MVERIRRHRRVVAILVTGAVVATGAIVVVRYVRSDDTAKAGGDGVDLTAWQRVMAGTTESGETTVTMARQAFSLTFEPLPDVDVPSGSRDDIQSGSAALRMMIAHWNELTTTEHTAVLSYLPSNDPTVTGNGDPIVPATEGAAEQPGAPAVRAVGWPSRTGGRVRSALRPRADGPGPDDATKQAIETRVAALRFSLGARAGGFLTGTVELSFNTHEVEVGSAAYTLPHSAGEFVTHPTPTTAELGGVGGSYSGCFIALNPFGWSRSGTDLDFILAHELYHCYEGMFVNDLDTFYDPATAPSWVIEGGANWAAAQVVPTSTYPEWAWRKYLLIPSTSLFVQTYEAIGFWNHLGEISAIDTWSELRSALGKSSADAFARTDGSTDAFLDSWASSLFRQPQFGAAWQTNGPTMSAFTFTPEEVSIDAGSRVSRSALPHGKRLFNATIATDVLEIVSVGHVTLHNPAHDEANFGQLVYCAREEGCECPPGSANTSPSPAALGGRAVAFGVTGSNQGAAVAFAGISLDEWCGKANPPVSKRPASPTAGGTDAGAGAGSLCQEIVDRLGVDGLLNNPTMSPADIRACIEEILGNAGFGTGG